jgi:hypothetical protein
LAENAQEILKEMGGDLIMRRSSPADAERLPEFNARIHGEDPFDANGVACWVRDLLTRPHPTFSSDDFLIVEKKETGEIVSSLNTISQVWCYEGIPFKVGRPELVGTDPEYRNRGLVRAQFEVVHQWSRDRGELVQVITGIPYYYRQFGYEMGLELSGGRMGYEAQVPKLKEGEEEPYHIRPAVETDLPFLVNMGQRENEYSAIGAVRDDAAWRAEMFDKSAENINRCEFCIIENREGQKVGYFGHPWFTWGTMQTLTRYMLVDNVSYLAVNASVIRYLWQIGQMNAEKRELKLDRFGFWLGSDHPSYRAAEGRLVRVVPPYAYYVRVPDLPAFLRTIAPALEARLRASVCSGHSGELKISFYRTGIRMVFENGRLAAVEDWKPKIKEDEGAAAFPNLTFLHLVFGYRSIDDIRSAFIDCYANDEAKVLLEALFPKKASSVWPIS